ncbi:MAG: hypothetical protein RBS57_17640 [Desulforhabdus sp.]|jgi:hypothetical protein|nr:hypothetical protein [Desulforhabdus sp.]
MRCPKCGFNSFDYLSECGKCAADLSKTRQELGFADAKPTMPFLLGVLLKEQKAAEPEAAQDAGHDALGELEQAGFGLKEDLALSPGEEKSGTDDAQINSFDWAQPLPVKPVKPSLQPAADDDISFDLSGEQADWSFLDEEVNESLRGPAGQSKVAEKTATVAHPEKKAGKPADQELVIELSEEDLEGFLLELEDQDEGKGDQSDK